MDLCLLAIHAHPDDEASKGSATTAKYAAQGVRSVLVCCTGGEAGEVLNPALDTPQVRDNLAALRLEELRSSTQKLYYTGFSPKRIRALDQAFKDRGEESPYSRWFEKGFPAEWEDAFTTYVDVGDYIGKRTQALLAHRTQVDPDGFWMRLPDDVV